MTKSLKIEDIKENEWYWDNYDKIYFQVIQIRTFKKQIPETLFEKEHTKIIHKIMRVYPKNAKYGQDLTYVENRFYKHKEDAEMTKADDKLRELCYVTIYDNYTDKLIYGEMYSKQPKDNIEFEFMDNKTVWLSSGYYSVKLLQIINQKIKELGWLDNV